MNQGPSWFAAGKRQPGKSHAKATNVTPQKKDVSGDASHSGQLTADTNKLVPTQQANSPNKDTSMDASQNGQGASNITKSDPAQGANDGSEPSVGSVRLTHRLGSAKAAVSLTMPAWMLCFKPGTEDGTH
ncbi:hypothetical protein V8E55_009936 [Tylopilus felleus]